MKLFNALIIAIACALALPALAQQSNMPMVTTPNGKVPPTQLGKPPAVAAVKTPPATPTCKMDSRYVDDGTTWCVQNSLQQCNGSTRTWINTGKRCS